MSQHQTGQRKGGRSSHEDHDKAIINPVHSRLLKLNSGSYDSNTCAKGPNGGVTCHGVRCDECPFRKVSFTLGELRALYPKPNEGHKELPTEQPDTQDIDGVKHPDHYMLFDNIEAIEVIARAMTKEMFKGYILGTLLKYRLRAGKKVDHAYAEQDLAKADAFRELYEKYKDKCYA